MALAVDGDGVLQEGGRVGEPDHGLVPRRRVDGRVVEEQEVDCGRHLGEGPHPLLHEGRDRLELGQVEPLGRPWRIGAQPRQRLPDEGGDGQGPDVLGVDGVELLDVEEGGRRLDVLDPELGHHLLDGDDLPVVRRGPSEEGEVVAHGLGQVAPLSVLLDGHVVATLGQLLALLVDDQGQVGEHRQLLVAQRLPDQQDLRRRGEEVLPTDHVGDGHVDVVHRVGQQEHGRAIGALDHEVLEVGVVERDVAPDEVVDDGLAVVGDPEPQGARGEAAVAAPTVVAGRRVAGPGLHVLPRAVAEVGVAGLVQASGRGAVGVKPLGLAVGTLVPVDPQPAQRALDALGQLVAREGGIGVLDPEDERAALVAGVEPVEQRGPGPAHVEEPRGRGRETDPDWHPAHGSLGIPWPKRY